MTNTKGLTMTIVAKASSANYGESLSNISSLKKFTAADGHQYTYISRQAIRYNIADQMGVNTTVLVSAGKGAKKVIQYAEDETIQDRTELDLFGYMKTNLSKKKQMNSASRPAPIRISNAIAQSPYASDYDFLTNLNLAQRFQKAEGNEDLKPNIAQSEIDTAFYVYTISIDLDQIGVDENDNIELSNDERSTRIQQLLDTIHYLYRDIKGRREDLSPLFIVGGVYDRKKPFFENTVKVNNKSITLDSIKDTLDDPIVSNHTEAAFVHQIFDNESEIEKTLPTVSMNKFFENLKKKVNDYYASL